MSVSSEATSGVTEIWYWHVCMDFGHGDQEHIGYFRHESAANRARDAYMPDNPGWKASVIRECLEIDESE